MNFKNISEIDYAQGLARFSGKEAFYNKFIARFLDDDTFAKAKKAYESGDKEMLFKCVHTLKGTSGNLSLNALYKAACSYVDAVRANRPESEQAELFSAVEERYNLACSGIRAAMEE